MLYLLFSLLCVVSVTCAHAIEPTFSPKIIIKNESSRIIFFKANLMRGAQSFFHIEPKNMNVDLDVMPRALYFVPVEQGFEPAQAALLFDANATKPTPRSFAKIEPWCIIDDKKHTSDTCWSRPAQGTSKGMIEERYMISSCTNPLVTQAIIKQAQQEQKDIIVTIRDGESQVFVGTAELVGRSGVASKLTDTAGGQGFFESVYQRVKNFFSPLFGKSKE